MKSGLEGRNNQRELITAPDGVERVSMKSGLEGRNNKVWNMITEPFNKLSQ